jgi:hypothetical protein
MLGCRGARVTAAMSDGHGWRRRAWPHHLVGVGQRAQKSCGSASTSDADCSM